MKFTKQQVMSEFWRLVRFFVVGVTAFLIYAGLYALLSRWLWVSGNHTVENVVANVLGSIFGFFAHRKYTYQSSGSHIRQAPRFLVVMLSAMALQAVLFWVGHELLHMFDFLVMFLLAVIIPIFTFILHRVYTFRHHPASPVPPADPAPPSGS